MGFVVEYSSIGFRSKRSGDRCYIPSVAADKVCDCRVLSRVTLTHDDKMACGIIQAHSLLCHPLTHVPLRTAKGHVED
jgi:hypothetical protein